MNEATKIIVHIRSADLDFMSFADLAGETVHFDGKPEWWKEGWVFCVASDEFRKQFCLYPPKHIRINKRAFCYSLSLGARLLQYMREEIRGGRYAVYVQFRKAPPT